tara:strand:- start:14908 stop:15102 length:195 start_codon:yes stop_codon:yes gene_type:complete
MIKINHDSTGSKGFSKKELHTLMSKLVNDHFRKVSNYHKEAADYYIKRYLDKVQTVITQIAEQK